MSKLTVLHWERAIADAAAALNKQALVEGVDGADDLAPVIDQPTFEANQTLTDDGMRKLAYMLIRAAWSTAPAWESLQAYAANGWFTGNDGRPAASWRRLLDGRIALRGRLTGSSTGPIAGPLPAGARPATTKLATVTASGGSLAALVSVRPDGFVYLEGFGTGASSWLELDAAVFDLG
jgi:hypothetical protein